MRKVWLFLILAALAMMVHFGVRADDDKHRRTRRGQVLLPEEPECQWEYNINHIAYDWELQYATKIWVKNLSYDKVAHIHAELLWDKQQFNVTLQPRQRISHTFYVPYVEGNTGELTIWSDQKLAINVLVWGVCDGNQRMAEVFVHETSDCPEETCELVEVICPKCPSLTCPDVIVPPCPDVTCCQEEPEECEDPECEPCQGKVTEMTMEFNRCLPQQTAPGCFVGAQIRVEQKGKDGGVVFDEYVESEGRFVLLGMDKHGTLGTELTFYVDGIENTKIHTSCSDPDVGPGFVSGSFEVIEGFSREGGTLCSTPE